MRPSAPGGMWSRWPLQQPSTPLSMWTHPPSTSTVPDYEAELAIIMGKTCKDVSYDQALDCVMGYTIANDVSARCWQDARAMNRTGNKCLANSGQWSFSKSFDTHCPLGPAIVHKDELGDATTAGNSKVLRRPSTLALSGPP